MSDILISNKVEFLSKIHDIQFRYNKKYENFKMSDEEFMLLKNYLASATSYVNSYLDSLVRQNPSFEPKLRLFRHNIKEPFSKVNESSLEIFTSLICKQMIDEKLTLYRGTSKMHFSATNLIRNNSRLTFDDLMINDCVRNISSLSTTLDPFIAMDFCCGGEYGYLLVEYNIDKDSLAFWANPYSGYSEKEFILPPNQEFIVDEISHVKLSFSDHWTKDNDGINYVKMHTRRS